MQFPITMRVWYYDSVGQKAKMRLKKSDERKLRRMLEKQHFDVTQKETLPDAYKQFQALKREMAKLKNRVRTLEKQVEIMFKEHKRQELEKLYDKET